MSKMFALAEDWKLRPEGSNPCRGIRRYAEHKVERFLSGDELARLGAALTPETMRVARVPPSAEISGRHRSARLRAASIAALRLLLLTGCRAGEVLSLRGENVNLERRLLLLSDSKTGSKPVFLSMAAAEFVGTLRREAETEYVFPRSDTENPGNLSYRSLLTLPRSTSLGRSQAADPRVCAEGREHSTAWAA
jgi:integrase